MCRSCRLAAQNAVLAVCALWSLGGIGRTEEPPPPAADTAPGFNRATLERKVTVTFDRVPLNEVIKHLSDKAHSPIVLDRKALADEGIDLQTPVTLKLTDVKLRKVLDRLRDSEELAWVPRDELLLVTTQAEAANLMETRVYDVRDLYDYQLEEQRRMSPDSFDPERLQPDAFPLVDLVDSSIEPSSWNNVGRPGSIGPFGGTLVISQTYAVHEKVEAYLAKLRDTLRRRKSPQAARVPETATVAIRRALDTTATVDFTARPLNAALQDLAEKHKIAIRLDDKNLADAGVPKDIPITFQAKDVRLNMILDLALRSLDLTHLVMDDEVLVTTSDEANNMVYPEVYDVSDLINPSKLSVSRHQTPSVEGELRYDYESLTDLVVSTIAPTAWETGTGPSEGSPYLGTITWRQTQKVHAQIAELLSQLRAVHKRPIPTLTGAAASPTPGPADPNALELRVYKLDWWLDDPQRETKVKPATDVKPHAEKKEQTDPPASVLQQFGAGAGQASTGYRPSAESLRYTEEFGRTIVAMIEPKSWQEAGGQGTLRAIPSVEYNVAGRLVIRQTAAVHQQIGKLLRDLRSHGNWGGGFGSGGQGGGGGGFF